MKFVENLKKLIAPILLGIGAIVLTVSLLYLAIDSDNVRSATALGTNSVSYVFVNEDLGATFNGVSHNFGAEFVNVISQDDENRWQTASRSVAEAGFRTGTFDVMIILPQNFSERLLSLESFSPEQAQIIYEVRLGYNELANMAIREQVSAVLDDFNMRIIQMYFSSILGNVFNAQLNVGAMINDEQNRHSLFVDGIRSPFHMLPDVFSRAITDALFLESETERWREQHEDFHELTNEILTTVVENLTEQLAEITEYVDLLQLLNETNLQNVMFVIEYQSEHDEEFYREQFTELNDQMLEELNLFYHGDVFACDEGSYNCDASIVAKIRYRADKFYKNQNKLMLFLTEQIDFVETQGTTIVDEWTTQLGQLENKANELLLARDAVAETFFSDANLTPDDVERNHVRNAIISLITPRTEYHDFLAFVFLETLVADISRIAVADLQAMISHLYYRELITTGMYAEYTAQLNLIERFADETNVATTNTHFAFIEATDEEHPLYQHYHHVVTLPIMPDITNVFRLRSDADINIVDIGMVVDELQIQMDAKLATYAHTALIAYDGAVNELRVEVLPPPPPTFISEDGRIDDEAGQPIVGLTLTDTGIVKIDNLNYDPANHYQVVDGNIIIAIPSPGLADLDVDSDLDVGSDLGVDSVTTAFDFIVNLPSGWTYEIVCCSEGNIIFRVIAPVDYEFYLDYGQITLRSTLIPPVPPTLFVTLAMDLEWYFSDEEKTVEFGQAPFYWLNIASREPLFRAYLAYFAALNHSNVALTGDVGVLLEQINLIGAASRQIVTLFGAPTTSAQTIIYFYDNLIGAETISYQAPDDSIYRRYGDFSTYEKHNFIVDALITLFWAQGTAIYEELTIRYEQIILVINAQEPSWVASELADVFEKIEAPTLLFDKVKMLADWHTQALANITVLYENWETSELVEITKKHHSDTFDSSPSKTIYYDELNHGRLTEGSDLFFRNTEGKAERLINYDAMMANLEDDFANIVTQTTDMHDLTTTIADDMGWFANWTDTSVADNLSFSENFVQVMNSARIGGVDNPDFLSFLAAPIMLIGSYINQGEASFVPYYLTIIITILSFAFGYGLRYFFKQRKKSTKDEIIGRGLIWHNLTFTIKAVLASLTVGLIFSGFSVRLIDGIQANVWLVFVSLLVATVILIITYLARQFPKTTLFVVGAMIAIYLLLNPILGVQVESGTFASLLFNLSPLYQIEQLFGQLTTGTVGILNFGILFLFVLVAATINLLVVEPKTKFVVGGEAADE